MQMDVNKMIYPFYAPKIMTHVHERWKGVKRGQDPLDF